mgnify:CR=1 FL=1
MTLQDVQKFVDDYINPALESHGGFLTITKFDDVEQFLYVELGGGCQGCSMSRETLQVQIRSFLLEEFPDLKEIIDTTNHSAGNNPYYTE